MYYDYALIAIGNGTASQELVRLSINPLESSILNYISILRTNRLENISIQSTKKRGLSTPFSLQEFLFRISMKFRQESENIFTFQTSILMRQWNFLHFFLFQGNLVSSELCLFIQFNLGLMFIITTIVVQKGKKLKKNIDDLVLVETFFVLNALS